MSASMLELENFEYYYGNIHAIHNVSLYINEGEIVTLVGSNGAGKSTTLRSISGLTDAKGVRGKIRFQGKEIQGMSGHKIASLGISQVLEGRHIFAQLSVTENLIMGAYLRNDTTDIKKDMEDVFRRFPRLKERRNQLGGTLSGGEQQMLAIARSMMSRPKLMLLDEPSLGLAPIIVKEIFEAIKEINRDGMTILFVEQNCNIALKTAQRGYVLQTGNIVLEDNSTALLNNDEVRKTYLGIN